MANKFVILDKSNLSNLPKRKSVYLIFGIGKIVKNLINYIYVGETDNLEERTKAHFKKNETNECLKKFMQSSKIKMMIYELMANSTKEERLKKEKEWKKRFKLRCN